MSLVPLVTPDSEADVLTTVALLEAYGIPVHVRGAGMAALYPVAQPDRYNSKTLLVPEERLEDARNLLNAVPQLYPEEDA